MSSATASDGTLSDVEPVSEWRQGGLTPRQRLLIAARKTARERYWDVYDRDSYECPVCGAADVSFHVHHIDGDALNNHFVNLIGICSRCHRHEHKRRRTEQQLDEWRDRGREVFGLD